MPIKGMTDMYRPKKIGSVRLGIKVPVIDKKTGKQKMKRGEPVMMPEATDHFVVPEEVESLCGAQPKQLPIFFLMDRDEEVFPHNLMLYAGNGALRCMGDGERVMFRRHYDPKTKQTSTLIYGEVAKWEEIKQDGLGDVWESEKGYGTLDPMGNTVKCLYMDCPRYGHAGCKPTGMLRFAIKDIIRQGYWQMVVHLNPMVQLLSQIRHGREFIEQYCGRPTIMHADWILELTGPEKMWINNRLLDVYTPELELDPAWMEKAMGGRVKLPQVHRVTVADIYGEPGPEEPEMDPGLVEDLPFEPMGEEEEVEDIPF